MLTVLATPTENRVLLDANNTVIRIQSSNGAGYYFRALISIDDELFDTQGWSRSDAYTAAKDLKQLYSAYFQTAFNQSISNGLTEQTHLIKKVSIVINEYDITDDSLVQTETLPDFYIMFNQTPVAFNDADKIQFLGVTPEAMQIQLSSKLSIPFFVNADGETVTAKITDGSSDYHAVSQPSVTGKKAYLYTVDLSSLSIPDTKEWLTLSLSCGATTIEKTLKVMLLPNYAVKTIAFQNNFGYFLRAYFDGDLEIVNTYKGSFYDQADGFEKPFEISEDATYTLNTGTLLSDEKQLIPQICNALDARLFYNGQWLKMTNKSKRYREFVDNNYSFEEDLLFNLTKNQPVANQGVGPIDFEVSVPETLSIYEGETDTVAATIIHPGAGSYTYLWEVLGGVTGITLSNETTATVTLAVSSAYLDGNPGSFQLRCTVTNEDSVSKSDETTITVADVAPFSIDIPETLEITEGYSDTVHATLTEIGSGSYTWLWEILSDPTGITLTNEDAQDVTVSIADDYIATNGDEISLRCTATDAFSEVDQDTMTITVVEPIPFSVDLPASAEIELGIVEIPVTIVDPGDDTYTYLWTFESPSDGLTLSNETTDTCTVSITGEPEVTEVTLKCTVTNSIAHSEYDTMIVYLP